MSARLAEVAGFKALHLTGMGVEATLLGAPDVGVITMSELVSLAARITESVSIPLLADIDTGFGGPLNIHRTVRELERVGVAGIHLEDQAMPKRCPFLAGRSVVSQEEGVSRIKAACNARQDTDFVIVARTDADIVSYQEVVDRCNVYLEAGADMVMPMTMELFKALDVKARMDLTRRLLADVQGPVMTTGSPPETGYTAADLADMGFSFIMFASAPVLASANALLSMYASILERGLVSPDAAVENRKIESVQQLFEILHLNRYLDIENAALARQSVA